MNRRRLIKSAVVTGALAATSAYADTAPMAPVTATDGPSPLPRLENPGELRGEMLYRELGWTGDIVSAIGFGGSHFAKPGIAQNESIRLCHAAIDRGITFMDNSWDYNKGVSETRMGQALSGGYRNKVFLMTKVDGRNTDIAQQQLEQSLKRLQTDRLDLWMFHEVLRYDDPDRVFAPGGAIHAAVAAKQSGKIRHIGFTGHKDPHIHIQMMEVARQHGFQFDVVLMPSNVMDAHLRSFARLAMPVALDDHIGVITMKPFGGSDGVILKSGASIRPIDCLHYALNRPTSVVITGIDNQRALDQAFNAATIFHSYTAADEEGILAAPASAAHTGQFELFKTTDHFDGTAHNPAWLGADTVTTMKLAPKNGG